MADKSRAPQLFIPRDPTVFSNFNELGPIVDELNKETDRGAALFSASVLDDALKAILTAFLVDSPLSADLFENTKPLATFSSRQNLCYALGLISKEEYDQCSLIRKVRNEFAHSSQIVIDFNYDKVAKLCNTLSGGQQLRKLDIPKEHFNRFVFILTVSALHWGWADRIPFATENKRQRLLEGSELKNKE